MKTLLLGTVLASLALLTSCSKSSSNGDGNNSEAPETLDGTSLVGELYVDYQEGDGFELEAKILPSREMWFHSIQQLILVLIH